MLLVKTKISHAINNQSWIKSGLSLQQKSPPQHKDSILCGVKCQQGTSDLNPNAHNPHVHLQLLCQLWSL